MAEPTRNRKRTLVYSVRLSPEESNAIQRVADARHLPASTLVRSWILDRLERETNDVFGVHPEDPGAS